MPRQATKAVGNVWYEARKRAAEYDKRLLSREGAAELLGMSVSAVSDAELGLSKTMPVDKAVLMADLYNAPELLNYYCVNECPIGGCLPLSDEVCSIDRVTIKLLDDIRIEKLTEMKDKLLRVARDGTFSKEEINEAEELMEYIKKVSVDVSELKTLCEKVLRDSA